MLKTLSWDKVDIEVISIELEHAGEVFEGSREEVHSFMKSVGYEYVGTLGQ